MKTSSFTVGNYLAAASHARARVTQFCSSLSEEERSIAVLLTSELITTAVANDAGNIRVHLSLDDAGLRIEVTDDGHTHRAPESPTAQAEEGWRWQILDSLSTAWGTRPGADGRGATVWFTLAQRP